VGVVVVVELAIGGGRFLEGFISLYDMIDGGFWRSCMIFDFCLALRWLTLSSLRWSFFFFF